MKIVICTKRDLAGNLALNRLVRALAPRHSVHVVLSDYVLKAERANLLAACLLNHERDMPLELFYPYLDDRFPEGSTAEYQTFSGISKKFDVPVELWGRASRPETAAAMRDLAPDVILSCRYDFIFREDIISIPRLGIYGMHPGVLPQIQGLCGPFRAMQMRHARSGCTVFHIDPGIDSGDVVDVGWADIQYDRSLLWNFVQTYFAGIEAFLRHLPVLEQEERLPGTPQDKTQEQYFGYPTEDEFRQFAENGGRLIDMDDYRQLLSLYLPQGLDDPCLPEMEDLLNPSGC